MEIVFHHGPTGEGMNAPPLAVSVDGPQVGPERTEAICVFLNTDPA